VAGFRGERLFRPPLAHVQPDAGGDGDVRKSEYGELVVYADRIIRTETNDEGKETEHVIPFLKGYTVFNTEQCDGLPAHYYAKREAPALSACQCIATADTFFTATRADIRHGDTRAYCAEGRTMCRCHPSRRSETRKATPQPYSKPQAG
jgi:antirestriction protein ArdC